MEIIKRFDIVRNKIESITMFDNELTRWLKENNATAEDIMKVKAEVPNSRYMEEEEARTKSKLVHNLSNGMVFSKKVAESFMTTGDKPVIFKDDKERRMKVLLVSASDARKVMSLWVNEKLIPSLGKWLLCGLTQKDIKLAVNKFMAYIGLMASASKRFGEVFGKDIDIRRVVIVKDYEVVIEALTRFIANERHIDEAKARKLVINAFDGMGFINAFLTNGESMTIRGPWIKAFVQAVSWPRLKKFLEENGIEPKLVDFWGVEHNIDDVDVVLTASCFKAAKLYKSWDIYCDAFEALGHAICVCVREHQPKLKGMPYQQGQTLMGTEADAEYAALHSKKVVDQYRDPDNAIKLLPKWMKRAARKYKALLNERHIARTLQEKYTSRWNEARGGRILDIGCNAFAAADITALVQWCFGAKVTGFLKAGECFCYNCKPGEVDVTRSPHLDNAHVILNCVPEMPLAMGPTMFVNIFDLATIRLRCDYDGDHFWYSQDEWLLSLVHRTYERLGEMTFDWVAPAGQKVEINRAAIANFVSNLMHGSEIGLYADALTKLWNHLEQMLIDGKITLEEFEDMCGWLTYGANVIIDAAKHGEVDKKVMDVLKDILKEANELPLPEYCRFAKADLDHPANSKYWTEERYVCVKEENGNKNYSVVYASDYDEKKHGEIDKVRHARTKYTGSFLDMYGRKVDEIIPKTLVIKETENAVFDVFTMMIDPHRKMGRLAAISLKARHYDQEADTYVDGGLFQEIAFRHAAEWKALIKADDEFVFSRDEWEEAKREQAIKEIIAWCRAQYKNFPGIDEVPDWKLLDAAYDIITRNIFTTTKTSDAYDTAVKNAYWMIFGEKANEVLKKNLECEDDNFDLDDDDDEDNGIW